MVRMTSACCRQTSHREAVDVVNHYCRDLQGAWRAVKNQVDPNADGVLTNDVSVAFGQSIDAEDLDEMRSKARSLYDINPDSPRST